MTEPKRPSGRRRPDAGTIAADCLCGAGDRAPERYRAAVSACVRQSTLANYDPSLARLFRDATERNPDGLFLAERDASAAWREVTYEEARRTVDSLAQGLIERGLNAGRPVMILSGNSVDHALLTLAGHTAGIPVAPISVAYSLQSQDHAKLKHIAALLTPGLIYVSDTGPVCPGAGGARSHRRGNPRRPQRRQPAWRDAVRVDGRQPAGRLGRAGGERRSGPTPSPSSCSPPARPACRRASSTPTACSPPTSSSWRRSGRSSTRRRWCCSTGCRGTIRSAPTTTSTWCCATPARCSSTAAGRSPV